MGRVLDRLLAVLDEMVVEAKAKNNRELLKEITKMHIRLQRGCFKGKIKPGPLTYEQKEAALLRLYREKGWDTREAEESFRKRRERVRIFDDLPGVRGEGLYSLKI